MRRMLVLLLVLPVAMAVIVFALYIYKFGSLSDPTLSPLMSDWGLFGDYVGGTLGTYFGFLAFVGVLGTVLLQHLQLEDSRARAKLEELQRLINSVSSRSDALLDSPPSMPVGAYHLDLSRVPRHPLTVFTILSIGGTVALADASNAIAEDRATRIAEAANSVRHEVHLVLIELSQLVWCLKKYAGAGGANDIEGFYKLRYGAAVCWIHSIGLLSGAPAVEQYFEPQKLRAQLAT